MKIFLKNQNKELDDFSLLMFYLVVEVAWKPVIEETLFYIASRVQLQPDPVFGAIKIHFIWDMTHLRTPYKPVTLEKPAENNK